MIIGLIDGQWVARRNMKAMQSNGVVDYKNLVKTFYSSIAKLCIEFGVTNPVILWDKYPYFKSQLISLKTSRYYPKEEDKQVVPEGATAEEVAKIEAANKYLEQQIADEREFQHAKNFINKFSRELGVPSVCISGLEADDLSYIIANKLGIKHDFKFITLDSDWRWMMSPNTTFYRCTKTRQIHYKGKQNMFPEGIPLLYYGILSMMYNNHNDVATINFGMPIEKACAAFKENQLDFYLGDQAEKYRTLLKALDPNTFFTDKIKDQLLSDLEIDYHYYDGISVREFNARHNIFLNYKTVGPMLEARDRSCGLLDDPYLEFPKELANE